MNRVDELHQCLRCAICEELFKGSDDILYNGSTDERTHAKCWEKPDAE